MGNPTLLNQSEIKATLSVANARRPIPRRTATSLHKCLSQSTPNDQLLFNKRHQFISLFVSHGRQPPSPNRGRRENFDKRDKSYKFFQRRPANSAIDEELIFLTYYTYISSTGYLTIVCSREYTKFKKIG